MAIINGNVYFTLQPLQTSNSSAQARTFYTNKLNYIKSANDPLRYQITWVKPSLTEIVTPSAENGTSNNYQGDVLYIQFRIEACVNIDDANTYGWDELARINKTRDVANKQYLTGNPASNHRFTLDVSELVQNELSYSLCPIGKGTWQSNHYGGMNGGRIMPDNALSNTSSVMGNPVSYFNVSKNGTYRLLRVTAVPFIIANDGRILETTNTKTSNIFAAINSVNQFETDPVYYLTSVHSNYFQISGGTTGHTYKFLSRCNNYSTNTTVPYKKPVRLDEAAEYLNFYVFYAGATDINAGTGSYTANGVRSMGMKIETFDADGAEDTFYVRDFEDNLKTEPSAGSGKEKLKDNQEEMCTQNISPYFINNTAPTADNPNLGLKEKSNSGTGAFPFWTNYTGDKIKSDTLYYRVSLVKIGNQSPFNEVRFSEFRYFTIDREDEKIPYEFVRFHWLNSMGATDSYTAKRNIAEGMTISRDVIERNSSDRTWYQNDTLLGNDLNDSVYVSDTMRGGNIYKGGREVSNVNANKINSVYTEPLNTQEADWLKGMMLSPNVWIEMDTEATSVGNHVAAHLRPSTKEYIPVIINNTEIESTNQEQGLVTFNIEYTLSHKVITQRN